MNDNDANSPSVINKRLVVFLHAGFVCVGILSVLLGQVLPFLTAELSLSDEQAGYFFVAQFIGSLLGAFVYNRSVKKIGYLKTLFAGFCLMAFGCAGLNFDWWILCLATVFVYGIGLGATIPAINLLIIEMHREKSSAASNLINFSWGIGAILSKPFVDFVGSTESIAMPTFLLGGLLLTVGASILFSGYKEISLGDAIDSGTARTRIWTQPTAWLIAVFGFLQVGIESSVAGWLTTYEVRLTETDLKRLISAALVYFLFLIVGRGVIPLIFRVWREPFVMFISLSVMTTGILVILLAENFSLLVSGAALLGFGTASVFPMNLARFTKFFGADATKNAMPLFVMGSFGSAFATWFIGYISTNFNSLRAGFSVILISCLMLILLQIILANKLKSPLID